MKNTQIGLIALVLVVVVGAFMLYNGDTMEGDDAMTDDVMVESMMEEDKMMMAESVSDDAMMKETDEAMVMTMKDSEYMYSGSLADVAGGTASGIAKAGYTTENGYMLYATFKNLPELEEGYFYEGWIVRRGEEFSALSTGELEMVDGEYVNAYASGDDLTDHTFYVLTLEPDDGDPAPAEHVLEGKMTASDVMMEKDGSGDSMDGDAKMEK